MSLNALLRQQILRGVDAIGQGKVEELGRVGGLHLEGLGSRCRYTSVCICVDIRIYKYINTSVDMDIYIYMCIYLYKYTYRYG